MGMSSKKQGGFRKTWKHTLNDLHTQLSALEQQHQELTLKRESLRFKSRVLTAWLECLQLLEPAGQDAADSMSDKEACAGYQAELEHLLQTQRELLAQLQELEGGAVVRPRAPPATQQQQQQQQACEAAGVAAPVLYLVQPLQPQQQPGLPGQQVVLPALLHPPQLLMQTIAPAHDPIAYFRDLASRPPPEGVMSITPYELAKQHRDLALQLGVQLHPLENPAAPQLSALGTIKQVLDRHFHMLLGLILCGRQDVVESAKVWNLDTMEPLSSDSPLVDNQESIRSTVLPALKVTDAQADAIAYAMELNESLMKPMAEEIQQLQQQLNAFIENASSSAVSSSLLRSAGPQAGSGDFGGSSVVSAATAATAATAGAGDGGGGAGVVGAGGGAGGLSTSPGSRHTSFTSSSSGVPAALLGAAAAGAAAAEGRDAISETQRALEEQQKLLMRLKVVLKKQYHVAAASTAVFVGSLTYVQAAKMCLYRWPYTASLQFVAKAVWQQRRAQLQRQMQEQALADQQWLQQQ